MVTAIKKLDLTERKRNRMNTYRICTVITSLFTFSLYAEFVTLTSLDQFNDLLKKNNPIILKFSAEYCPPCKITKKPFKELAEDKEFSEIAFIDLDTQSPEGNMLSSQYKILGVPTFIFIQNGKEVKRIVGLEQPAQFKENFKNQTREIFHKTSQEEKKSKTILQKEKSIEEKPSVGAAIKEPQESADKKIMGTLQQVLFSIQAFFVFIFDKIKEVVQYLITLLRRILGK